MTDTIAPKDAPGLMGYLRSQVSLPSTIPPTPQQTEPRLYYELWDIANRTHIYAHVSRDFVETHQIQRHLNVPNFRVHAVQLYGSPFHYRRYRIVRVGDLYGDWITNDDGEVVEFTGRDDAHDWLDRAGFDEEDYEVLRIE